MTSDKIKEEIISVLENLEPNKAVTLSTEAGKHLLETIRQMKELGELA